MPLIKDIATFKRYVKYNFTSTTTALPDTAPAERKFVLPFLGNTLYASLQSQVDANNITNTALLDIVRAAAAPLSVLMDLPLLQTQLGDTGLRTLLSEQTQAAHRWEYNEVKAMLEEKGMQALEDLLNHLEANAQTYEWELPVQFVLLFKTGSEFKKYYPLQYPARTFMMLQPLIEEVEELFIKPSIGAAFFEELRDEANAEDELLAAQKYMKRCVANLTVMRAMEKLPVRLTPYGLLVTLDSAPDQPYQGDGTASTQQMGLQHAAVKRDGESYLNKLVAYLNEKASEDLFETYYGSEYYKAPSTETKVNPNINRKGILGL